MACLHLRGVEMDDDAHWVDGPWMMRWKACDDVEGWRLD
jgi:hypothetical protein